MKYKLHTTLNAMLKSYPCEDGLNTLKKYLDENNIGPNDKINLLTILEVNGLQFCLWVLKACLERESLKLVAVELGERAVARARVYSAAYGAAAHAATAARAVDAVDAYAAAEAVIDAANAVYASAYAAYTTGAVDATEAFVADAAGERERQRQDLLDLLERE